MYTYICGSGCSREWEVDVNSYDHKMWFSQVVLESTTRCCFFSLFMTRCSGKWIHDDLLKNYNVSFTLLYIILPYTYFSVRHFAMWFILIDRCLHNIFHQCWDSGESPWFNVPLLQPCWFVARQDKFWEAAALLKAASKPFIAFPGSLQVSNDHLPKLRFSGKSIGKLN